MTLLWKSQLRETMNRGIIWTRIPSTESDRESVLDHCRFGSVLNVHERVVDFAGRA
jgi:hypothetical protein